MLYGRNKALAALLTGLLWTACVFAQEPAKNWKDRGEYDLYVAISGEQNAQKRLGLLETWKSKYAETDYEAERNQFLLVTYQQLNQPAKMIETASGMLAKDPKSFQALYWLTFLAPTLNDVSPAALDRADKAAEGLLGILDDFFSASKRPATTSEADWAKAKDQMEAIAHKTLGWVDMQKKEFPSAEQHLVKSLQKNAAAGEVSYWLGTVTLSQKTVEKNSLALYHFARAATYAGEGALNQAGWKLVSDYLDKVYVSYHGEKEGLEELKQMAASQPTPPADFKVKSKEELRVERENKLLQENPQLALWINIRRQLSTEGAAYFEKMKGALLPPLKGKVISGSPANRHKELVLGIEKADQPEVTLILDSPLSGQVAVGTEVEFEGIGKEFTAEPFMVVFDVTKDKLKVPEGAISAPAPAKAKAKPRRR